MWRPIGAWEVPADRATSRGDGAGGTSPAPLPGWYLGRGVQGRLNLVVDLSGVYFMDSTGLAVLAVAHKRLQQAGGGLVLAGPTPAVRRSIDITGLDQMMPVTDALPKVSSALLESTRARDRAPDVDEDDAPQEA